MISAARNVGLKRAVYVLPGDTAARNTAPAISIPPSPVRDAGATLSRVTAGKLGQRKNKSNSSCGLDRTLPPSLDTPPDYQAEKEKENVNTSETREFPTAVIASLSTVVLFCEFSKMHEAAEFLMGHPIWIHHFASKDLWQKMRARVVAQVPDMPSSIEGVTNENYLQKIADVERQIGASVTIRGGNGETAMHPLEGIPAGKPTAFISVED